VTLEAASPGEMKNGGAGNAIEYGFGETHSAKRSSPKRSAEFAISLLSTATAAIAREIF